MPEKLILKAAVRVATIWENKAKASGRLFWKIVAEAQDPGGGWKPQQFTAFDLSHIARIIEGHEAQPRNDSRVWNFNPPIETTLYFEATSGGNVIAPAPEGEPAPAVTQPAAAQGPSQAGQGYGVGAPPGVTGNRTYGYKKSYGGGKDWKPKDERPGLVTMTESYAKDIVAGIIAHNADLGNMDPAQVIIWAREQTIALSEALLNMTIARLNGLGFKIDPDGGAK